MRIIAGEFKGRRISAPEGQDTRPMLDRVREALFSTLGERVEDAVVLDLFAGSGSLGMEALSRGARLVRFVERDRRALARLRQNVADLDLEQRVEVSCADAFAAKSWTVGAQQPSLVFMDPPYPQLRSVRGRTQLLEGLDRLLAAAPGASLVLHTHPRDLRAGELDGLPLAAAPQVREYGNTALWYMRARG